MFETFPKESLFIKNDTRTRRWAVPYHYDALNSRVENIIINHKQFITGKRILDLGCHFGSFSYACLEQGARFVQGVDSERKLIAQGKELFKKHHLSEAAYQFNTADVIAFMESLPENSFDTVLCLGIFYYLSDPVHALKLMRKIARKAILIDTFTAYYATTVAKDRELFANHTKPETFELPMVYYPLTKSQKKDYKLISKTKNKKGLDLSMLALPTLSALENFFRVTGLKASEISWKSYCQNPDITWQDFSDQATKLSSHWADIYYTRLRVTYLLEPA